MTESSNLSKHNDIELSEPGGTAPGQRAGQDDALQTVLDALANLTPEQLTMICDMIDGGAATG